MKVPLEDSTEEEKSKIIIEQLIKNALSFNPFTKRDSRSPSPAKPLDPNFKVPFIIGICGGPCSGKSSVVEIILSRFKQN